MISIIPTSEAPEKPEDNCIYVVNEDNDSMFKKYNRGIEFALKQYPNEQFFCLRHDDTEFRQQPDVIEYKLRDLFKDKKIGMCGVIGCIALFEPCVWWTSRTTNGIGAIIQGFHPQIGVDEKTGKPIFNRTILKEKFMSGDFAQKNFIKADYAATVDGCCMFFPRWILEQGLRFDENLQGYHFYDADICCQVLERGYKVGIVDVVVFHKSMGEMPDNFNEYAKVFHDKWNERIDSWPISRLTKFKAVDNEDNK